ncbi:MAG: phosphopentomutase [Ruthenibacterium sp.]
MAKRVFLIILDSFGIGEMPDASGFGDENSNTLAAIARSNQFSVPTLQKLGLFNIDGVSCGERVQKPTASFARLEEASKGKDTTIGHWEIAGVESLKPLPVYPDGFPEDIIKKFEEKTGHQVLCNKSYSGTEALRDFGEEHMRTGQLIVYTSADSVFQVAAHEAVVPVEELYRCCQIARDMLPVGRVIARPFTGSCAADFKRTTNRHDLSLRPPAKTMLDFIQESGDTTIGVGKIYDIFDGVGISEKIKTTGNHHGMEITLALAQRDFHGLAFINLVDFDMLYGHRNDVDGYAAAATEFDGQLAQLLPLLRAEDLLILTADHGCDPETPSTDHSRECVPLILYSASVRQGVNLGTRKSFSCIAKTVCEFLGVRATLCGESLWHEIVK